MSDTQKTPALSCEEKLEIIGGALHEMRAAMDYNKSGNILDMLQEATERALHSETSDYEAFVSTLMDENIPIEGWALGLCGEAGELGDLIKKQVYHKVDPGNGELLNEAGDVLFYLTALLMASGHTIDDAIEANKAKLTYRYPSGFEPGGGNR